MIELKNLSCSFSKGFFSRDKFTAVSPLNVSFKEGERYAIVGESGSGKTTLARMIAGLQKPSTGNVFVNGEPLFGKRKNLKKHFRKVQIIHQNSLSALDPKMIVGKSIEEPLVCFFNLDKATRRKKCEELMKTCNLPIEYYGRLPKELSGGEQKRVAIARALAVQPQYLIFDEATNGFDLPLKKKIIKEIIQLQQSIGFTIIFITHDIVLATEIGNEILVMKDSRLLEKVKFSGDITVFKNNYSKTLLRASCYNKQIFYMKEII